MAFFALLADHITRHRRPIFLRYSRPSGGASLSPSPAFIDI